MAVPPMFRLDVLEDHVDLHTVKLQDIDDRFQDVYDRLAGVDRNVRILQHGFESLENRLFTYIGDLFDGFAAQATQKQHEVQETLAQDIVESSQRFHDFDKTVNKQLLVIEYSLREAVETVEAKVDRLEQEVHKLPQAFESSRVPVSGEFEPCSARLRSASGGSSSMASTGASSSTAADSSGVSFGGAPSSAASVSRDIGKVTANDSVADESAASVQRVVKELFTRYREAGFSANEAAVKAIEDAKHGHLR